MEGVCVTQRATRATTWETTIYIRDLPPPPKAHPSLGTTFSVSQLMHAYPHGRDTPKKSMPWEIFAPSSKPSQPHACRIPTWVITSAWRLLILAQSMQRPAEVADSSPPFPLHMDASTLLLVWKAMNLLTHALSLGMNNDVSAASCGLHSLAEILHGTERWWGWG